MKKEKCVAMRFSPKNSILPYTGISPYKVNDSYMKFVESYSNLGIVIDRSLKFQYHIRCKAVMVGGLTTNLLTRTISRKSDFIMNVFVMNAQRLANLEPRLLM